MAASEGYPMLDPPPTARRKQLGRHSNAELSNSFVARDLSSDFKLRKMKSLARVVNLLSLTHVAS